MIYVMMGGITLLFLLLGAAAAWARWQGQKLNILRAEIRRMADAISKQDDLLEQVESLRVAQSEQATMNLVYMQVLMEKGMIDESELEEAHLRIIVEPAMIAQEQEALLADLPDLEQLRKHLVRLPTLLQ